MSAGRVGLHEPQRPTKSKMMNNQSPERIALQELVDALRSNAESGAIDYGRGTTGVDFVDMAHPEVVSALREAEAVLGKRVSK